MNIDPLLLLFLLFVLGPIVSRLLRGTRNRPPQRPPDTQKPQQGGGGGRRGFEEELSKRLEEARRRVQEAVENEGGTGRQEVPGTKREEPRKLFSSEGSTIRGEASDSGTLSRGAAAGTVRGEQTKTTVRGGQPKVTVRGGQSRQSVRSAGARPGTVRADQPTRTVREAGMSSPESSRASRRQAAEQGVAAGELGSTSAASSRRGRSRDRGAALNGLRVSQDAVLQGFIWHEILSEPLAKRKRRRMVSPHQ